ncbi:MAG: PIN domain-containing protein [Euryarchaeota archaeon]|nr:PIN domain-containing protein [Euryarchaeota archaeon]
MAPIFVDTSVWVAIVDARDPHHGRAADWAERHQGRLVTSTDTFDETITLVLKRCGHDAAVKTGDLLRRPLDVELIEVTEEDRDAAWGLFMARSDKKYSFTDCTSFAVMRRLAIQEAATFDRDFEREGFKIVV